MIHQSLMKVSTVGFLCFFEHEEDIKFQNFVRITHFCLYCQHIPLFSYMLYNSKWFETFLTCSQLSGSHESKKAPPIRQFLHRKVTSWTTVALISTQLKEDFWSIKVLITSNPHSKIFWNFSYTMKQYYYKILSSHVPKNIFFSKIWSLL